MIHSSFFGQFLPCLIQVALVTPLRDGMNLVAKEFVACQDDEDPGVLILSPFAGAGGLMQEALQVATPTKHLIAC